MNEKEYLEEIKNNLTIEQIENLLFVLKAEPVKKSNIIIARTVCHNGHSHKLYYYENTHLFRCYTECSPDTFDVFQLVMKILDITLPKALQYILNFFNLTNKNENFLEDKDSLEDWKILDNYLKNDLKKEKEKQIVELKKYNDKILNFLPKPRILIWEKEGILKEVMDKRKICYNPSSQAIVIPHFDSEGQLIGIRERTLIKENESYGKYRPMFLNKQLYNHPLGFSLYNLNNSKENIKKIKKVIIFEGEKGPMQYASYFGEESDITVACCGSNLSLYQVKLLLDLGVEEIIIAFDKQFKKIGDAEWRLWTQKLKDIHKKYGSMVQISFLFDKKNLLDYKDSPIDKKAEVFLQLFKERVILN